MPKKYTYIDFAKEVLAKAPHPLSYQEMWARGQEMGLDKKLRFTSKTPSHTLAALLYGCDKDDKSEIAGRGESPKRFHFRNKISTFPETGDIATVASKVVKHGFKEIDLHEPLAYYVRAHPSFAQGKTVYAKTVNHTKSLKGKGFNEWTYPDMVGAYMSLGWDQTLINFRNVVGGDEAIVLYSFEIKKSLHASNYREAFFQAVSNSSWANEGYLVAPFNADDDDNLMLEMRRLSASFGIGLIRLDVDNIHDSEIKLPARRKISLDWETMNKLAVQNPDFREFLNRVKIDFDSKRVHESEYDSIESIEKDTDAYMRRLREKK